ncbi:catenin alpha-1-like [Cyanistes caeruleus]|uniref:catenin alpha-1-like n=1 Tax=Cyanistes caeruleus TaxID=156563 RepID=UPI000CDA45A1|nr:catenin alpha-1-like [Cyanistes caeruleus]
MDNYEPGVYTEKVLEATKLLSNTVMPRFTEQVEAAVEALSSDPAQPMDENEFIDASRLVYDGIRDIRKAVLMIRVRTASPSSFPCPCRTDSQKDNGEQAGEDSHLAPINIQSLKTC